MVTLVLIGLVDSWQSDTHTHTLGNNLQFSPAGKIKEIKTIHTILKYTLVWYRD